MHNRSRQNSAVASVIQCSPSRCDNTSSSKQCDSNTPETPMFPTSSRAEKKREASSPLTLSLSGDGSSPAHPLMVSPSPPSMSTSMACVQPPPDPNFRYEMTGDKPITPSEAGDRTRYWRCYGQLETGDRCSMRVKRMYFNDDITHTCTLWVVHGRVLLVIDAPSFRTSTRNRALCFRVA